MSLDLHILMMAMALMDAMLYSVAAQGMIIALVARLGEAPASIS